MDCFHVFRRVGHQFVVCVRVSVEVEWYTCPCSVVLIIAISNKVDVVFATDITNKPNDNTTIKLSLSH
tara:strand:+ start:692 stop:895 length:204 start_codon:yes stop_codon:yes gene_type:complete